MDTRQLQHVIAYHRRGLVVEELSDVPHVSWPAGGPAACQRDARPCWKEHLRTGVDDES